jgi:hypothetical protein
MGKRKKPSKTKIPLSKPASQNPKYPHLSQEINTIVQLSQHREARLITLGKLIFFSTKTGDAWILDTDKGLAKCLSRDGEKQAFTINETSPDIAIVWDSEYRIKGSLFTVLEYSGSICSILGYPTRQIEEAIQQMGLR